MTLGIWIGQDNARNEREIVAALELARHYPNVFAWSWAMKRCFGANTAAAELVQFIRRVKRESPVPVASAENWKIFIDHPELGDAVINPRPYHSLLGGLAKGTAVEQSLEIYDNYWRLSGKTIVIGEFGWPSAGHNFQQAVPRPISQAVVLRNFVARANTRGIDYNIIEAIDEPEKLFEGNVGPYWGILDA